MTGLEALECGVMLMTPRQLERIGRRIWGGRWKSPLARAIGMTYSHINLCTKGEAEITRRTELSVLWLDDNPEQARELGARASAGS